MDLVRPAFGKGLLGPVHRRHVSIVVTVFRVHALVLWDVVQRIRGHEVIGVDQKQAVRQLHGCDVSDLQDFPKCSRIDLRLVLYRLPEQLPQQLQAEVCAVVEEGGSRGHRSGEFVEVLVAGIR